MASYNAATLFRVDGLVVAITGGGSGLGRVAAHAFASNGAKAVYILGRRENALNTTRDTSSNPDVIKPIVCDITSKDALKSAADRVRDEVGYLDLLFANSGVITADNAEITHQAGKIDIKALQEGLWQFEAEEYTQSFHLNVTAAFYTVVAFLTLLDEGNKRAVVPQKSQVIITTSVSGYSRLIEAGFAYGTSKAGTIQLAKQLATLLAPYKIRVNTIAPGLFPSEMTEKGMNAAPRDLREEGTLDKELIALQRTGTEEDFAGAALFLASAAGGYLFGTSLVTDGGRLSIVPSSY